MIDLVALGKKAKSACAKLNRLTDEQRNAVLLRVATLLRENCDFLISENAFDISLAKEKGMSDAFIDRLTLNKKVVEGMAVGFEQVALLSEQIYRHRNTITTKFALPFNMV